MAVPRKIQCRLDRIVDYHAHVYTLVLSSPIPLPPIKPGQFLHLAIDPYDPGSFWPESRIFSIAKVDREVNELTICYSVKGVFTSRMESELAVGTLVWIKLPFGDFVVDPTDVTILIAGGTGITPFVQYLTTNHEKPCVLVYGARNKNNLLFKQEIDQASAINPFLKTYYFVEEFENDFGLHNGKLNVRWIIEHTANLINPVFYLSGPPMMISSFSKELQGYGKTAENIRKDAWE